MDKIKLITKCRPASAVIIIIVCLVVCAPIVHAQEPCNLKTMEGTYAIYETGNSFLLSTA